MQFKHRRKALTCALIGSLAGGALAAPTSMPERWAAHEAHQRLLAESRLHGLAWRNVGPVMQGGRVVDIEGLPGDPSTFYALYASAGLWVTRNAGLSFEPLTDGLPTLIGGDLAMDPSDPQKLWLGTGEPNSQRSSYSGYGVFRSTDGGASWQHAGLDFADRIARVKVHPTDGNRVCVAVQGRLYTPGGKRGVFCTRDAGATWQHVLDPKDDWTGASDLVIDPANPEVMYAALWERSRRPWNLVEAGKGSGVFKSTDGGATWARVPGFPSGPHIGRIGLTVSPSNPSIVYASIDHQEPLPAEQSALGDRPLSAARLKTMTREEFLQQDPEEIEVFIRGNDLPVDVTAESLKGMIERGELTMDQLRGRLQDGNAALFDTDIRGLEIWRSDDAGGSWRRTHESPLREVTYTYGYYFGELRVAPDNPDRLYAFGVPVIYSEDGGKSFKGMNDPSVHVDHHAWWIDPKNPKRMINGNDGGIDITWDGGKTWSRLDRQPVGQSYTVQVDLAEPYNIYTGLQDNGTVRCPSNARPEDERCEFLNGGDGMQVQVDPRDHKTVYTGYQFGWYRRSDGQEVRPRAGLTEAPLRWNWQTPILLSPHNADILYMGANRLFRSMDRGQTFTAISPDLTRATERGDVPYATITSIDESTLRFGLLWAGTDDGQLHVSRDGGVSWTDVGRKLPDLWVSRVVASQHVEGRAYVSLNAYRNDDMTAHVYVTEDYGQRWTRIDTGIPAAPVNVVREDPVNPNLLYVGTDRGVYVSLDRGGRWEALPTGLPTTKPVHDLVIHPRERELVIGTHGRSVYIVDVLPLQQLTPELQQKPLHAFYVDPVQASRGWRSQRSPWFHDPKEDPKVVAHYWAAAAGPVQVEVRDVDGRVLRRLSAEAKPGVNRLEWDLLVEQALALDAEARAREKLAADKAANLAAHRYAESVRLGHPLYVLPGTYTLAFAQGAATAEVKLEVKAPKAFEPRAKPKPKRRGE